MDKFSATDRYDSAGGLSIECIQISEDPGSTITGKTTLKIHFQLLRMKFLCNIVAETVT